MAGLGFGYNVKADILFTSNGVEIMRVLGNSVEAVSAMVDANTKAIGANAKAMKALVTEMRSAIGVLGTFGAASKSAATDITAIGTAADKTTASLIAMTGAFNAAAMGIAAFGPASRPSVRVIPTPPPAITRASAAALGAGIFADRYYSPSWSNSQKALPPWRDGGVPVPGGFYQQYEPNWRNGGPGTGWDFGGYRGTGEPFPSHSGIIPYAGGQRTWRAPNNSFQGEGPGPSMWGNLGTAAAGVWTGLTAMGGPVGRGIAIAGGAFRGLDALTGGMIGHFAEGAAAVDAVTEAARLQARLQSIYNIVGAVGPGSGATQTRLRQLMFEAGNQFAMSPVQAADMFRETARQSQGTPLKLPQMEAMLPYIARMQVVLANTRGMGAAQTTDAAMNFVHLMRMYHQEDMPKGFDLATRLFELSPVPPSQLIRQLTYAAPIFKNLNIPNEELGAIMLTLARTGFGTGKGATGIADLLQNSLGKPAQLILSPMAAVKQHLMSQGEYNLLDKAGFPTWTQGPTHQADAFKLLMGLEKVRERDIKEYGPERGMQKFTQLNNALFGIQASRMISLFSNPEILKVLQGSMSALKDQKSLGLTEQSNAYLNLTTTNINRGLQNFQALMTELGWIALPAVSKAFRDFGDTLHDAQRWLNGHKEVTKQWSDTLMEGVKGVERFFLEHKKDILAIGGDLLEIGKSAFTLGLHLAGLMGPALTILRTILDFVLQITGTKKVDAFNPRTATNAGTGAVGHRPGDVPYPTRHQNLFAPAIRPPNAGLGAPGHRPQDVHHHGNVSLIINVNGSHDPKATAKEVKHAVAMELDKHFGNPRSLQNSSSESRTHRAIPSIFTKAIA